MRTGCSPRSPSKPTRPTSSARRVIGTAAALALAAVLGLVSTMLARVRDPLAELVDAARRLARGELDARVPDQGPAELRTLGGAFNAMAGDLSEALGRLDAER